MNKLQPQTLGNHRSNTHIVGLILYTAIFATDTKDNKT